MKIASFVSKSFPPASQIAAVAVMSICGLCGGSAAHAAVAPVLTVQYPSDGAHIAAVRASFAFGATTPGSRVTVNGVPATTAPDGAWIAYVPFTAGRFVLHVRASLGGSADEVDRMLFVDDGSIPPYPSLLTVAQPGERLTLAVSAPDGKSVNADGPGFSGIALHRAPTLGPGAFGAVVAPQSSAGPGTVTYHIRSADGTERDVISKETLEISARPVLFVGSVVPRTPDAQSGKRPYGMLGPTPDAPTEFTAPPGTPFAVTARQGDEVRVALGWSKNAWIDRREIAAFPNAGNVPSPTILGLDSRAGPGETLFRIHLKERTPFRVFESVDPPAIRVEFFNPAAGEANPIIQLPLHQKTLWGYDVRWLGHDLAIDVRTPPKMASPPRPALSGLLVVIDPGHSPDSGAVGPLGTMERDVNLDIAKRLALKLRALDASVVMTRDSNRSVLLYDRPALAERLGADVLISVHNNAWPDGVDPATQHGYSVYYFQPHSLALARAIHAAYGRDTDLPDAGLHSGDFALVRSSRVPAVLTESAFITWPWEEMKLRDAAYRDRLAATISDGMETWAESMRRLETARP